MNQDMNQDRHHNTHHDTPTALARRPLVRAGGRKDFEPPRQPTPSAAAPPTRARTFAAIELWLFRLALAVTGLSGLAAAAVVLISISIVNDPGPPYYGGTTNMDKAPFALAGPGLAALTALTATLCLGLTLNAWHRRLVQLGELVDSGRA